MTDSKDILVTYDQDQNQDQDQKQNVTKPVSMSLWEQMIQREEQQIKQAQNIEEEKLSAITISELLKSDFSYFDLPMLEDSKDDSNSGPFTNMCNSSDSSFSFSSSSSSSCDSLPTDFSFDNVSNQ
jgi:hypothetical protein